MLTDLQARNPFEEMGCTSWESANLYGLSERLHGERHLSIFGVPSATNEQCHEDTVKWLLDWLNQGKTASLLFKSKPDLRPSHTPSLFRDALRYLYPFAEDGLLKIGWLQSCVEKFPRILCGGKQSSLMVFSAVSSEPILGTLLPEPCYTKKADMEDAERLGEVLNNVNYFSAEQLSETAPLRRWALEAGDARNLDEYFEPIKNQHIEHLIVRDPFCGVEGKQREFLISFLNKLNGITKETQKITIFCKEQNSKDFRYQPSYVVQREMSEKLSSLFPGVNMFINVYPFLAAKGFHDRSLEFVVIDDSGCSETHHYDLSGGIDYLMDSKRATKVYWYK